MNLILSIGFAVFMFAGAAAGTFFGQRLLAKSQYKKELLKLAVDSAIEDFKNNKDLDTYNRLPMSANLAFYYTYFEALEKGKTVDQATRESLEAMASALALCHSSNYRHYKGIPEIYNDPENIRAFD